MNRFKYLSRLTAGIFGCLALLLATMMLPPKVNAQAGAPPSLDNTNQTMSTGAYWTPELLAGAQPMPMPAVSGAPQAAEPQVAPSGPPITSPGGRPASLQGMPDAGVQLFTSTARQQLELLDTPIPDMYSGDPGFRFTSSRLESEGAANLGAYKVFPNGLEGQLFFTVPPGTSVGAGNYVCSATVQRPSMITTAGHCVSDGNSHFYKNWLFVPAIRNGFAPFGKFGWKFVTTTSTWFTGGGGVPNAQDVAVIVLAKDSSGNQVSAYTGWAGFQIPDLYVGQHITALGYPCNLDSCSKAHRTDAQVQDAGGNNTYEIGADARGGASGGGWMINWGTYASGEPPAGALDSISKALIAVTSYGPISTSPFYLGASILDSRYVECTPLKTCNPSPTAILNHACVKYPGAC